MKVQYMIEKFVLIKLEHGYNDVAARSYITNPFPAIDEAELRQELLGNANGLTKNCFNKKFRGLMGLSVGSFISPHIPTIKGAYSSTGWQDNRGLFIIVVSTTSIAGVGYYNILQGYTDYLGVSNTSNALDMNMLFYLNSVTSANYYYDQTTGERRFSNIRNSSVLADYANNHARHDKTLEIMRPGNVLENISYMNNIAQFGNATALANSENGYYPEKQSLTLREDQNSTRYFTNILNAFGTAIKSQPIEVGYGINNKVNTRPYDTNHDTDIETDAAKYLAIQDYNEMGILNYLKNSTQTGLINGKGVYSYADLLHAFPDIEAKKIVMLGTQGRATYEEIKENEKLMVDSNGLVEAMENDNYYGEYTKDALPIFKTMADLNNGITHAATAHCLATAKIYVRCILVNGVPEITNIPLDGKSFLGDSSIPEFLNGFIAHVETELLPKVVYDLSESFELTADISIIIDNKFAIKLLDSKKEFVFKYPTFADSLYNPIITTKDYATSMLHQLSSFTNNIKDQNPYGMAKMEGFDLGGEEELDYDF